MIFPQERRWLFWFAVVVLLVTSIPYLLGFALQGDAQRFTGFVLGVEDGNSYIAKMLSGAAGNWLFESPYSIEPQRGMLAFLPYILLGKLTAPPGQHEQLIALFQLFRWIGGFLYIWATYDFLALFVTQVRYRRLGVALAALGGGLGGLIILGISALWQNNLPLEFYSPETFGFLSILTLPHLSVARALLLWGLCFYLRSESSPRSKRAGLIGGLLWLLLGIFQPLTIVSGWVVLFAHLMVLMGLQLWNKLRHRPVDWRDFLFYLRRAVLMVLLSSPMVTYNFLVFKLDPFLNGWEAQNLILSPPPLDYMLAYGLILAFSLRGLVYIWKNNQHADALLLLGWVILLPILIYAPHNLQRRLPEGVWAAWITLGMIGIEVGGKIWRRLVPALYFGFLPTLILLASLFQGVRQTSSDIYRPYDQTLAFQSISTDAIPGSNVVCAFSTGNALPAWAPVRVVVGHGPESVHLPEYQEQVRQFYCGEISVDEALEWLSVNRIKYIILGPAESDLCSNAESIYPNQLPGFNPWKIFGDYLVYKVPDQP